MTHVDPFATFESVSADYHGQMAHIQEAAGLLVRVIGQSLGCKNVHELMDFAKVTLSGDELAELLQSGMVKQCVYCVNKHCLQM